MEGEVRSGGMPSEGGAQGRNPDDRGKTLAGRILLGVSLCMGLWGSAASAATTLAPVGLADLPAPIYKMKVELCREGLGTARDELDAGVIGLAIMEKKVPPQSLYLWSHFLSATHGLSTLVLGYAIKNCTDPLPADPFDADFTMVFESRFHPLPSFLAGHGLSSALAARLDDALSHGGRAVSYLQVINVSLTRYSSAVQQQDEASALLQQQAVATFLRLSIQELRAYQMALSKIAALVRGTPLDHAVTAEDVHAFLEEFQARGAEALPTFERGLFPLYGIDPTPAVQARLSRLDPTRVPLSVSDALTVTAQSMGRVADLLQIP
jgi:hypothetical protein